MLTQQHPEDIRGACFPTRYRKRYTPSQQLYQKDHHLRDSNLTYVRDFQPLKSRHGSFTLQSNDHQSIRKTDVVQSVQTSSAGTSASTHLLLDLLLQSPKKSTGPLSSISKKPGFNPKRKSSTQLPAKSHQNADMDQPTAGKIGLPQNQPGNLTDDQIQELVYKKLQSIKAKKQPRLVPEFSNSTRDPHPSTSSDKNATGQQVGCAVTKRCPKAAGCSLGEGRSESSQANAQSTSVFNREGQTSTFLALSTEYPRLMMEVAATCTKNEEEAPPVLTAVWPSLRLCCNSSNTNTTKLRSKTERKLDCTDPKEGLPSQHSTESGKGNKDIKPVDVDSGQSMAESAGSKLYSPTESNHTKPTACHQKTRAENTTGNLQNVPLEPGGTFSVTVVKDPQYEDVSESEGELQLDMKHQESDFSAYLENIGKKENLQTGGEISLRSPQLSQTNIESSKYVHDGDQREKFSNLKTPNPDKKCMRFIKTDTGFTMVPFPNYEGETGFVKQANTSSGLSSTLEQTDDEMDDWLVVPLLVCDITMEEENDGPVNLEEVLSEKDEHKGDRSDGTGEQNTSPLSSGVASLSTEQEVSERHVSFAQPHSEHPTKDPEIKKEPSMTNMEAIAPQDGEFLCESDDSCATENSSDYSGSPERNKMTVSRQVWQNRSLSVVLHHNNLKFAQDNKDQSSFHKNEREIIETSAAEMDRCEDVNGIIQIHKISPSDSLGGGPSSHVLDKRKHEDIIEANIPQSKSKPHVTIKEMAPADSSKYAPSKKTQLIEAKTDQQDTNKQLSSNEHPKSCESQKNVSINRKAKTPRRIVSAESSETEDSEDGFSDEPSSPCKLKKTLKLVEEKVKSGNDQQNIKLKSKTMSPKNLQQKQPQSADSGTSPQSPRRIIHRLFVQPSASSNCLKLSHKSQVHSQVRDKTSGTPKASTVNGQESHTGNSNSTEKSSSKPKSSNNQSHNVEKVSVSTPNLSGPKHDSSFTPQQSEADSQPSTACLPSTSTRDCSASKAPQSLAMNKVMGLWKNGYVHRQRKSSLGTEDSFTNDNLHPTREPVPGTSSSGKVRRRRKSLKKSETPLMKRTKSEAKERTRDIKCNPPRPQSSAVADHYKWKTCSSDGRGTGFYRQGTRFSSSPDLDEWD